MGTRTVKVRYYAVLKRRVADAAWPNGKIPQDWLLGGAPLLLDPATGNLEKPDPPKLGLSKLELGHDPGSKKLKSGYMVLGGNEDDPDADVIFVQHLVSPDKLRLHLRAWKVRRSNLPSIHNLGSGNTSPIQLSDLDGIAEATDFVFFFETGIVGQVINRAGPARVDVLKFIEDRTGVPMRLSRLMREDALDLVVGDRVTSVAVEVAVGHIEALAEVSKEISGAARLLDGPGLATVRLTLSVGEAEERGHFWEVWKPKLRSLANERKSVEALQVGQSSTKDHHAGFVDLLDEQISLEVALPIETGRTVEGDRAAGAIVDGFATHNDLIARACERIDIEKENQRTERAKVERKPKAPAKPAP